MIIDCLDIRTYLAMRRVSRSIRSMICVARTRIPKYTVLHRVPGFMSIFAARSTKDNELKIELRWQSSHERGVRWELQELSPEQFDKLKREENAL